MSECYSVFSKDKRRTVLLKENVELCEEDDDGGDGDDDDGV